MERTSLRKFQVLVLLALIVLLVGYGKKVVRVEDLVTDGDPGTVPTATISGNLLMSDAATQAELDAATLFGEVYSGELAHFRSSGVAAQDVDSFASSYFELPAHYSEVVDKLDSWQARSQGDDGSVGWLYDNLICYEPKNTKRIWLDGHCYGTGSPCATCEDGMPCAADGDCAGVNQRCIHEGVTCPNPMWDVTTSPDTISFDDCLPYWDTGHSFGTGGTIYGTPVALLRGDTTGPVWTAGDADYPTCAGIVLEDTDHLWVYVSSTDADDIFLYHDDGDLEPELGAGDPPSGGADVGLDCTLDQDWQSLVLFPTPGGEIPSKTFEFTFWETHAITDLTPPASQQFRTELYVCQDGYEAISGSADTDWLTGANVVQATFSSQYVPTSAAFVTDVEPGECLERIGYIFNVTNNDLDRWKVHFGEVVVKEAERSAPQRTACPYGATDTVTAACQRFGLLHNEPATGGIVLTLQPFEVGQDVCVVNRNGNAMTIDPDGTDRFEYYTDSPGDSLDSDTQNEVLCFQVLEDGTAFVTYNDGWVDGD